MLQPRSLARRLVLKRGQPPLFSALPPTITLPSTLPQCPQSHHPTPHKPATSSPLPKKHSHGPRRCCRCQGRLPYPVIRDSNQGGGAQRRVSVQEHPLAPPLALLKWNTRAVLKVSYKQHIGALSSQKVKNARSCFVEAQQIQTHLLPCCRRRSRRSHCK